MSEKTEKTNKIMNINLMVSAAFILLLYNIIHFTNLEGAGLPLPSTLFNMILFLSIIIFFLHKNDIIEKKGN